MGGQGQQVGRGAGQGGQFTGGAGDRGMGDRGIGGRGVDQRGIGDRGIDQRGIGDHGMGDRGMDQRGFEGRSFDRSSFFGGKDHNWWRQNKQHRYWNGNTWVFGVEPVGFVPVPVPVQSCPYSPEMFNGNPNACFFTCMDNGYDPIGVCNICCGTNY